MWKQSSAREGRAPCVVQAGTAQPGNSFAEKALGAFCRQQAEQEPAAHPSNKEGQQHPQLY